MMTTSKTSPKIRHELPCDINTFQVIHDLTTDETIKRICRKRIQVVKEQFKGSSDEWSIDDFIELLDLSSKGQWLL